MNEAQPTHTPIVSEINRFMDQDQWRLAALLARRARDATTNQGLQRRYWGLLMFANARLRIHDQVW